MKILISGLIIGVVAITVAVVIVSKNKINETLPISSGGRFVLAVLESEVLIKKMTENDFVKIDKEADVRGGDQIKTDQGGRASILYPNGHIVDLGVSSALVLKNLEKDGNQSVLNLITGSVRSKLQNVLNKGDFYKVETENMVASVRGTDFLVTFFNGISTILVYENEVEVQAIDPKTGQSIEGGFIILSANEKTIIDSANLPSKERPIIKTNINASSPTSSVRKTAMPSALVTPRPTPTPTPPATLFISKPSPTLTPTPKPKPIITSIVPSKLQRPKSGQAEFIINGQNLKSVKTVLINQFELQFFAVDDFTIFATVGPNVESNIYDVSVSNAAGETSTLNRAIEIQ
ncbi:MAG: FecR family protein [Patescibacteria group bacterium]